MTDEPKFAPFLPSPPTAPEQPAATKKTRKPRKMPDATRLETSGDIATAASAVLKTRKPRTPKAEPAKRSPKFDLQTILSVASQLKDADMKLFEKMLGQLQDATKGSRARVLAALEKVFA